MKGLKIAGEIAKLAEKRESKSVSQGHKPLDQEPKEESNEMSLDLCPTCHEKLKQHLISKEPKSV